MSAARAATLGVLCTVVAVAAGLLSYALAHSARTTAREAAATRSTAQHAAFAVAERTAAGHAEAAGYAVGSAAGRKAADAQGTRAGERAGAALLAKRRAAGGTSSNVVTSSGACPSGLVPQGTEACVLPYERAAYGNSAGCGGDPYSTPDREGGCIGPASPPPAVPGPAKNCPAGSVPVGEEGACAPASTVEESG